MSAVVRVDLDESRKKVVLDIEQVSVNAVTITLKPEDARLIAKALIEAAGAAANNKEKP